MPRRNDDDAPPMYPGMPAYSYAREVTCSGWNPAIAELHRARRAVAMERPAHLAVGSDRRRRVSERTIEALFRRLHVSL